MDQNSFIKNLITFIAADILSNEKPMTLYCYDFILFIIAHLV